LLLPLGYLMQHHQQYMHTGVLFSGGIDSVLLACLLHQCLPPQNSIDLLNVTFDGDGDAGTSISADHTTSDDASPTEPVEEGSGPFHEDQSDASVLSAIASQIKAFLESEQNGGAKNQNLSESRSEI
jgi:hypothetical protein